MPFLTPALLPDYGKVKNRDTISLRRKEAPQITKYILSNPVIKS